jgi:hypothetical protein
VLVARHAPVDLIVLDRQARFRLDVISRWASEIRAHPDAFANGNSRIC